MSVAAVSSMSERGGTQLASLDRLLDLPHRELGRLYRDARVPKIPDVRGDLRGRMLAWPSLASRPAIAGALRAFAGASAFPWRGKTFLPDPARGARCVGRGPCGYGASHDDATEPARLRGSRSGQGTDSGRRGPRSRAQGR